MEHVNTREGAVTEIAGETSIDIGTSVGVVYEYLRDFTRHPEWVANLTRVTRLTDGPIEVGAWFRASEGPPPMSAPKTAKMMFFFVVGLALGAKSYSEAEITSLEPDRQIGWRARLPSRHGAFNQAEWEFRLEPCARGTVVTQRFRYSPRSWAARQMVGSAQDIERSVAVSLAQLKRKLERTRPPHGTAD